jgi:hypothetical protein
MEKTLRGIFLDIQSSNESTIHPANGFLMQALKFFTDNTNLVQSVHHANDHYSRMLHCWLSKLKEDAEMIRQGEKGGKYIFLLNNICDLLQMMRRSGAASVNVENSLNSMIQRCTKSYIDQCWVPLNSTLHLNLDEFTAEFVATCDNQREWKVTAELRYNLRQKIVDSIVTPYEVSLSELQANRSRLSGVIHSFKGAIGVKKKQKKFTGAELKEMITELFEG